MTVTQIAPTPTDELQEWSLQVKDITKEYAGGIKANLNISMNVHRGEILGILGPNGAGKTTLVRQITTELLPTSGEIFVEGRSAVTEPMAVKEFLGVVPQEVNLFEYLTCHQHLRIFGKLRGLAPQYAKERAGQLIAELNLGNHRDMPVSKLSGGLRRRLLVGIAALARPKLMVLDEPTTGLDPRSRRDIWSLLRRYQEQGTSILITTHHMEEAEALCDRVGIIQRGQLLALDTIPNLRAGLKHQYKATYRADGVTGEEMTIYGDSSQELLDRIKAIETTDFELTRTDLEDVYFALTGEGDGFNEQDI